jgi:hypothetical protein
MLPFNMRVGEHIVTRVSARGVRRCYVSDENFSENKNSRGAVMTLAARFDPSCYC